MKKIMCILMAVILVFVPGCGITGGMNAEGQALLDEYVKNIDEYEVSVRDVGEPASYIHMDDHLVIGILYPKTDIPALDDAIEAWIEDITAEYKGTVDYDVTQEDPNNRSELTVSYESYQAGTSAIGVKLTGTFCSPLMAHPVDIVKTFNVNTETGQLFSVEDVFQDDAVEAFQHMLMVQMSIEEDVIDENIFAHGVLTGDGIEVVLARGDYLPMSEGTQTAVFLYEDVDSLLDADFDYETQAAEEPAEDVEETNTAVQLQTIDPDKPMVALTFDDGPSAHTERLLDIFAEHGGKGTFFVLGNLIDGREDTLCRTVDEGHEVANHSWDHRQLTSLTEEEIKDQIMMTRAKIYDVTGKDTLIVRAPYGACDEMVQTVGEEVGVSFYNWSIDTLDWQNKDPQAIYDAVIDNVSDGDIILCHDLHETTIDAMELVIPKLIEEGYQLVTVSELMEYSGQDIKAGTLYNRP